MLRSMAKSIPVVRAMVACGQVSPTQGERLICLLAVSLWRLDDYLSKVSVIRLASPMPTSRPIHGPAPSNGLNFFARCPQPPLPLLAYLIHVPLLGLPLVQQLPPYDLQDVRPRSQLTEDRLELCL